MSKHLKILCGIIALIDIITTVSLIVFGTLHIITGEYYIPFVISIVLLAICAFIGHVITLIISPDKDKENDFI